MPKKVVSVGGGIANIIKDSVLSEDGKFLTLPPGQLSRDTYLVVSKAIGAMGGTWHRARKGFTFPNDVRDKVKTLVKTGEVQNDKKTFEAFYTPMPLVARLVEMAELRKGLKVLEPSAGDGRIAFAAEKVVGPKNVTCCEIRDGEDGASVQLADRFPFFHGDFLEVPAHRKFDRIIMNPPFHRGTDIKHVTHALEFLNGAGLLVSVMSAGARTASTKVAGVFRERLYGYDVTWHDVEDGAFKESGTNVRTVILKVRVP